tara:strand:- start:608 stop:1510 length:903 start_codon:yes stop_codon:yes gene_type:complete
MNHTTANLLMLLATFIWGTAFVTQTTGMDYIGPFTFSFSRFFLGALTVLPLAIILEKKGIVNIFFNKKFIIIALLTGTALFGGMGLQQYALLKSQISNAAFLSTLYVPIVAIISRTFFKAQLSWIVWIAVLLCVYGSYLLTSNQTVEIQRSDILVFIASFFFALHIILIDIFMKRLSIPLSFAFIQYTVVFIISLIVALTFEQPSWNGIKLEWFEICYTGIMSTAVGYTLQIIAQGKANPAPAAVILSMESVFATLAGWYFLNQTLDNFKIFGCFCIFLGVVMVQLIPIYFNKKSIKKSK